jgi:hypothetical protein
MDNERLLELAGVESLDEATNIKKFAVSVAWSQTDHETFLVSAKNRKDAEKVLKSKLKGTFMIKGASEIIKDLS